jgi:GTPase SAR1 family protein
MLLACADPQFHSLAPMYYRNAAAAVVVYDITKAVSDVPVATLITRHRSKRPKRG